jgi:hypothetical protein
MRRLAMFARSRLWNTGGIPIDTPTRKVMGHGWRETTLLPTKAAPKTDKPIRMLPTADQEKQINVLLNQVAEHRDRVIKLTEKQWFLWYPEFDLASPQIEIGVFVESSGRFSGLDA